MPRSGLTHKKNFSRLESLDPFSTFHGYARLSLAARFLPMSPCQRGCALSMQEIQLGERLLGEYRLFRQDSNYCGSAGLGFLINDIVDSNRDSLPGLEVFPLQDLARSSYHRGFLVDEEGLA